MVSLSQEIDQILSDIKEEGATLHHIKKLQKLKFSLVLERGNFQASFKKALKKTKSYFNKLRALLTNEAQLLAFLTKQGYSFSPDNTSLAKIEFYVKALIQFNDQQEKLISNGDELQKIVVKEIQCTDYLLHILDYYNGNLSKRLRITEQKVAIRNIPAVLTLRECYEIYCGIKPLFFYHGTRLEQLKQILENKQLSPKKHFDKRFEEEIEVYNKVKSLFVFIREIESLLTNTELEKVKEVVNDLKRNKYIGDYLDKKTIKIILKESDKELLKQQLSLLLQKLNELKARFVGKEVGFYSVFKIRDPHFIFFGAEYPYVAQENFQSCTNYAGINGVVLEFYPALYSKLDIGLMRSTSEKILDLAVGTYREHAQVHGFLGHDLATRQKINIKFIRRIYTNQLAEVQDLVSRSGFNLPILPLSYQHKNFQEVMGEIELVLKRNGLIS